MRVPRKHWSLPYAHKTLCGRSVYFNADNLHLATRRKDVTCQHCLRILAEPWHGTHGGYSNHKCRCDPCTEANTAAMADWRARHWGVEPLRHGAAGYTNYGCRCEVCCDDHHAAHVASNERRKVREHGKAE